MEFSDYLTRWRDHRGTWMDRPQDWVWRQPGDRMTSGLGVSWVSNPGRANLQWLAMDMAAPPEIYDVRANAFYVLLTMFGGITTLNGLDLFDQAGSLTLPQFHAECENGKLAGHPQLSQCLPLMQLLTTRRLTDAHA